MVRCKECGLEMTKAETCTRKKIEIEGEVFERDTEYSDDGERCHDCGIKNVKGNVHHYGCDMERCPKCGKQLISCDCVKGKTL